MKTCYISAPLQLVPELSIIRSILVESGIRVLVPTDIVYAASWTQLVTDTIREADLVIAVVAADARNDNVFFELGAASALGKRVVILAEPKAEMPAGLRTTLQFRTGLDNRDALSFAIKQVLAAPRQKKRKRAPTSKQKSLGSKADDFIRHLDHLKKTNPPGGLESLVASALREAGVSTMATYFTGPTTDFRYDIAAWVDALQPYVGNPLPIEIKYRIDEGDKLDSLERFRKAANDWALLVYLEGPSAESAYWRRFAPTTLHISLDDLLAKMRHESFANVVLELRNKVAHGSAG